MHKNWMLEIKVQFIKSNYTVAYSWWGGLMAIPCPAEFNNQNKEIEYLILLYNKAANHMELLTIENVSFKY